MYLGQAYGVCGENGCLHIVLMGEELRALPVQRLTKKPRRCGEVATCCSVGCCMLIYLHQKIKPSITLLGIFSHDTCWRSPSGVSS